MGKQLQTMIGQTSAHIFSILFLGLVPAAIAAADSESSETQGEAAVAIESDPKLQLLIMRALNAPSEADISKNLDLLRKLDGPNYEKLVPQLLYYSMHGTDPEGHRGVKEAMALGLIAGHLKIRKDKIVSALIPYLETEDQEVRKGLRGVLAEYEPRSPETSTDFSYYGATIEGCFRNSTELPLGLVRHMFEKDPGAALITFMRAIPARDRATTAQILSAERLGTPLPDRATARQILWAEHLIADVLWKHEHKFLSPDQIDPPVATELEKASRSSHWWVRLYVAKIMRRHPGFRQPELIERLKKDAHPLVRKAMSFAPDLKDDDAGVMNQVKNRLKQNELSSDTMKE